MKELAFSVVVPTFTFLYVENAVRLVSFAVLLQPSKIIFNGGFFIFLFIVMGRRIMFFFQR